MFRAEKGQKDHLEKKEKSTLLGQSCSHSGLKQIKGSHRHLEHFTSDKRSRSNN